MLIELVTIGPELAIMTWPTTTHQKLLFTPAIKRVHAPTNMMTPAIKIIVRHSYLLYMSVETTKAGRKMAALQLIAKFTSVIEMSKANLTSSVSDEMQIEEIT